MVSQQTSVLGWHRLPMYIWICFGDATSFPGACNIRVRYHASALEMACASIIQLQLLRANDPARSLADDDASCSVMSFAPSVCFHCKHEPSLLVTQCGHAQA